MMDRGKRKKENRYEKRWWPMAKVKAQQTTQMHGFDPDSNADQLLYEYEKTGSQVANEILLVKTGILEGQNKHLVTETRSINQRRSTKGENN